MRARASRRGWRRWISREPWKRATVWLAEHAKLKTRVAIKVLRAKCSSDTQQVQRFFNEAIAVSKIKHAGTVKIFDVGVHRG